MIVDVVRGETLVRAVITDRGSVGDRPERLVLPQDRHFQRGQFGSEVDAQLLDENAPGALQRSQSVGLASAAVLGKCQNRPAPLP